jgi:ubiquinone/menaquinone biosynthesis C-methylase UbiE
MSQPVQALRDAGRRLMMPMPRSDEAELLDQATHDARELRANFRDIRRVNQLLGGTSVVLRHLPALLAEVPSGQTARILDLGTGSADIPIAIARWATKRGVDVSIVASDISEEILEIAAAEIGQQPEITLACYDARSVPLPDASFDIVLCSLSLHHFAPDEATQVLREMDRLGRVGFILNDLSRSRLGYGAAWVAARLTTRNRLTRNDAPLSVRRAYTPNDIRDLLRCADVTGARVTTHAWFRLAAVKIGPRNGE